MNRLASVRVGAVFASVAMALAGCDCGQATCDNSDLAVTFVAPTEGAMVEQTSNVQVSLARRGGAAVNIGTAKLEVRGPGATEFTDKGNGTADGATATFMGVMLAAGENALRATVSEANCTGSAAPVTIVVTAKSTVTTPPVIVSCTFPQDVNGDGTLNAAELPAGTPVSVRVLTTNGAGATFSAPNSSPAQAPILNETATISVPGPTADGQFTVTGTVTRGTGMPTCGPMIRVQRTPPTCSNTTADLVGPNNDADMNTPGFQLGLMGMVSPAVTSARFEVSPGGLTSPGALAAGVASGLVTIPSTGDVNYSVVLIATDAIGNECRAAKNVRANFTGPVLVVTSPVNPDGGSVDIAQTPQSVSVTTMGLADGRQVCVDAQIGAGMPTQVGCGVVANGATTFDLNLTTDGTTTFIVSATDGVGNRGETRFFGNVTLEGCVPAFAPALACPNTYLTPANAPGGMFAFTGSARMRCAGQSARLFIGTSATAAATTTVGASGAVNFSAQTLTPGAFDARIEVDRLGGGAPHSVTCAGIVLDLTPPVITNPAVPMTGPVVLNMTQDSFPAVPGAQRNMFYSGAIPPSGTVVGCMNQMAGSSGLVCPGNPGFFLMNPSADIGASPVSAFTFPEGEYQLLVAIRRGNGINSSAPIALRVDVTAPCVAMNGLTFPQDTAPLGGDNRLNVAELAGMNPRVSVQLDPACADPVGAPAMTLSIRELSGTVPGATRATGTGVPGTPAVLGFSAPVSGVQNLTLFAEAVDWVGNRNVPTGANNPAVGPLGIYPALPTCTIDAPMASARLGATAVSSGIFVQGTTSGAGVVGTNGVEFTLTRGGGMAVTQQATPAGNGSASSTFATQDGTYTLAARCTDLGLNQQTASPVSFEVDATPPACAVTAPTSGQTTVTNQVTTTVTVGVAETGATVTLSSNAGTVSPSSFALNGTSVTQTIAYPLGMQNVTVNVTDTFNNVCTVQISNLNVTTTDCIFTVARGFVNGRTWLNRTAQGDSNITINSPNCRSGQTATLTRTAPTAGTPVTTTTATNGDAVFSVTPANGEAYTISINNGSTEGPVTLVGVDFVDPVVPVGAFTVAGAAPTVGDLKFVAATGNPRVAGGAVPTPGYYADANPGVAGAQIALAVNGVTGGLSGTSFGLAEIILGTTTVASEPIDGDPDSLTFGGNITLPHPTTAPTALSIRVRDQAGNVVSRSVGTAQVDVIPPSNPSPAATHTKGGRVDLTWTAAVDDEGVSSSGAVTAYELRWTTSSVDGNAAMATEADYHSSMTTFREADLGAASVATNVQLPPFTTYYVALRARDDLDNYSPLAPLVRDNSPVVKVITDPTAGSGFGANLTVGDLSGDGVPELVVSASTTSSGIGAVYVYRGGAGLQGSAPISGCGLGCQRLSPPDGLTGGFGSDVSAAGNVGGPGNDLVVSQPSFAGQGRVFIFFGNTTGADLSTDAGTFVEIRGNAQNTNFGFTAKILRDIDNDGLDELIAFSPSYDTTYTDGGTPGGIGRAYVFRGRDPAVWLDAGAIFPLAGADYILEGPNPKIPTGTTTNGFGSSRNGFTTLGRPDGGSGGNDFAIGISRLFVNRMQLWSASTVTSFGPVLSSSSTIQNLTETPSSNSATTGLGSAMWGGASFMGNPNLTELVAGYPATNQVQIFSDVTRTGAAGLPLVITGPNSFGSTLTAARIMDSQNATLVVGEGGANRGYWLVSATRDGGFESLPTIVGPAPGRFFSQRFGSSTSLGSSLASGDVTNDGNSDVAAGDSAALQVRIVQ